MIKAAAKNVRNGAENSGQHSPRAVMIKAAAKRRRKQYIRTGALPFKAVPLFCCEEVYKPEKIT